MPETARQPQRPRKRATAAPVQILDLLRLAGGALVKHRLRSMLSLVGVGIGVAAVILLTALGEGARGYVTGQFAALGTNLLIVIPGRTETTGGMPGIGGAPNDLTLEDADAIRRGIPLVRRVVPISVGSETVSHGARGRQVAILGSTSELLAIRKLAMAQGQFLPPLDSGRGAPLVVLGQTVARELFPGESPVGKPVRIGEWRMRVIGVLAGRGTQLGVDMDEVAIVPVATGMRMLDRSSLFRIMIEVNAYGDLDVAKQRTIAIITERHDEEDITVLTQDAVVEGFSTILQVLTLAVAGIAAVSLGVAGVGVMNVMLVSVSERTAEIGLLKALGATSRQVLALFLGEAVLLTAAGGAGGIATGWVGAWLIALAYPSFPVEPPVWAILAAAALAVGAGAVFGVLPALRATRLDPVAALRGR